jgi:hypothetical protein
MFTGQFIFNQVMDFLPRSEFECCVSRYGGDYRTRTFSCYDQFLCMTIAQMRDVVSLRDLEQYLRYNRTKLYHIGMRGNMSRSTLADANESRDWHIYADLAQPLIRRARELYIGEDLGIDLQEPIYVFDSTLVNLCLSLSPWASYRKLQGAFKLHTLMDVRGSIPCFILMTDGRTHDVRIMDELAWEPGSHYIYDRAYLDFERLYRITMHMASFVIREKKNTQFVCRASRPVDRSTGLRADQTIHLTGHKSAWAYPAPLRRVTFYDAENHRHLAFLTNNFIIPALTVALEYKLRWTIEVFFRWIKQNLEIKVFYGYSPNAVLTQIWIAVCLYCLVLIFKKERHIENSPSEILRILNWAILDKRPFHEVIAESENETKIHRISNQLSMFD